MLYTLRLFQKYVKDIEFIIVISNFFQSYKSFAAFHLSSSGKEQMLKSISQLHVSTDNLLTQSNHQLII